MTLTDEVAEPLLLNRTVPVVVDGGVAPTAKSDEVVHHVSSPVAVDVVDGQETNPVIFGGMTKDTAVVVPIKDWRPQSAKACTVFGSGNFPTGPVPVVLAYLLSVLLAPLAAALAETLPVGGKVARNGLLPGFGGARWAVQLSAMLHVDRFAAPPAGSNCHSYRLHRTAGSPSMTGTNKEKQWHC